MNNTHNPEDELLPEYDFDYDQAHPNRFAKEHQKLLQLKKQISERRNHRPFDPPAKEYVHITREERNAQQDQLMKELLGESDDNSLI
ncbi:MAG: hypothetical protein RI580_11630 [Halothece sp. Uz-M2-17]|nr:hypothetical protein [Halothece sp. Uz-M2-17]